MEGLKAAKCALDRKVLADLAAQDAAAFAELVNVAKAALKNKPAATLAKA
jgi:large subunit ribosomal protein L20